MRKHREAGPNHLPETNNIVHIGPAVNVPANDAPQEGRIARITTATAIAEKMQIGNPPKTMMMTIDFVPLDAIILSTSFTGKYNGTAVILASSSRQVSSGTAMQKYLQKWKIPKSGSVKY